MKNNIVILILGIISVIASPENSDRKKNNPSAVSESSQQTTTTSIEDNFVIKQDNPENINVEPDFNNEVTEKSGDAEIDIVIQESIESTPNEFILPEAPTLLEDTPNEFIAPEPPTALLYGDEVQEPQIIDPYADDNVILKEPGEIMETAAGFVPIPIFRNRQKQRRRLITRRNFQRNPYPFKRFHFFYPYPFYHPSSLTYYRF